MPLLFLVLKLFKHGLGKSYKYVFKIEEKNRKKF